MKNFISRVRFPTILPLLVMAVLFTLPSTSTGSKYVWEDSIKVSLRVVYPDNIITSLLPVGYPSEFWAQELQNIRATATQEGLVLTAGDGYTLPESILVKLGETEYTVYTNGQNNTDGIRFSPENGMLTISDSLLSDHEGTVTIIGSAQ